MLILIVGDMHIPHRTYSIPNKICETLKNGKINHIICTGNLCTKIQIEELKEFSDDIYIVRGTFDDDDISDSEKHIITFGSFRLGVISSYLIIPQGDEDALSASARELDVDILCYGSISSKVFQKDNRLFISPGSMTGAFSSENFFTQPSFILLNIQGNTATVYSYTLDEDDIIQVSSSKFPS